jgi:hypothetical protein
VNEPIGEKREAHGHESKEEDDDSGGGKQYGQKLSINAKKIEHQLHTEL